MVCFSLVKTYKIGEAFFYCILISLFITASGMLESSKKNDAYNGSIGSIRGMLNHYRTKVIKNSTLDPALQNGISLTDAEADALILYLKTLTDTSLIKNPRFSQP